MNKKRTISFSTTHYILFSFLVAILLGSLLLSLPISSATGKAVPYIDALFTATTSTCVTGLVTLPTFSAWSFFGQVVILLLIQVGGLGIITIMSGFMIMLRKKMDTSDRLLIQDAFNLNTMSGLSNFIKKILLGTFIIEGIGALLYMLVFVPDFGARGVWISVFNSVSAFCNAGLDIIGENSLCDYATNPLINAVTCALIILGGIGFIVWWDVLSVIKSRNAKNKKIFRHLSLHTKIVLVATLFLILGGGLLIFIFEYSNPSTIGGLSLFDKIQTSLFQSITTRTAGFATIPQENLSNPSAFLCLILMFIGGSPVGTAGGVKTVTIAVLLCSAFSTVRNKNSATMFNRTIPSEAIRKAVAVCTTFVLILLLSTILLSLTSSAPAIDIIYETVSASATVGLSRNLTSSFNTLSKIIITITMYLGRIGPISLAVAFGSRSQTQNVISDPTENITIG